MSVRVLALASVILAGGCAEPEGPAARVALQIVRASADLDTSDITGFLVRVGVEQLAIPFDASRTIAVELDAPPAAATPIVVFGCTLPNGDCADRFGDFVGCRTVDLVPSPEPIVVTIALDARDPVPDDCRDLVTPLEP
jgi:hypothetical protein